MQMRGALCTLMQRQRLQSAVNPLRAGPALPARCHGDGMQCPLGGSSVPGPIPAGGAGADPAQHPQPLGCTGVALCWLAACGLPRVTKLLWGRRSKECNGREEGSRCGEHTMLLLGYFLRLFSPSSLYFVPTCQTCDLFNGSTNGSGWQLRADSPAAGGRQITAQGARRLQTKAPTAVQCTRTAWSGCPSAQRVPQSCGNASFVKGFWGQAAARLIAQGG